MARDELEEHLNISISRDQRQAWEWLLLRSAGISEAEANRIAEEAARDRAAVERKEAA